MHPLALLIPLLITASAQNISQTCPPCIDAFVMPTPQACIDSTCYDISIASTPEERRTGFMVDNPGIDGILFLYHETGIHCFWMANTSMPLHIAWLDENGTVMQVMQAKPYDETSLCPRFPSAQVLEIRSELEPPLAMGTRVRIID